MPNSNRNHRRKKGQAAIEFLVTYGWAILGAMIAIGALSYFGIFNTQRYVNDICYFGDQITCEDYVGFDSGDISLQLRNNFGVDINVTSVVIKSDYGTSPCVTINPPDSITAGSVFEVGCNITETRIPINSKLKYRATVTFERTGSNNLHNQTGDVTLTVQKQTATCRDTDRGNIDPAAPSIDYHTPGTVTYIIGGAYKKVTDVCTGPMSLTEYFCFNGAMGSTVNSCPCTNGKC